MRSPEEYREFLRRPNTGCSETGTAQGWWLIKHAVPEIKLVTIRRPLDEVLKSVKDWMGFKYDETPVQKLLSYSNRMLDQIEKQPDVLSVQFKDLVQMNTCRQIFEHCLPYTFDVKHWGNLKNKNLQIGSYDLLKYRLEHKPEIDSLKKAFKMELRTLYKENPNNPLWGVA